MKDTIELKLMIVENGVEHPNASFYMTTNSRGAAELLIEELRKTAINFAKRLCDKHNVAFTNEWRDTDTLGKKVEQPH